MVFSGAREEQPRWAKRRGRFLPGSRGTRLIDRKSVV
jgi:hypothetical protein